MKKFITITAVLTLTALVLPALGGCATSKGRTPAEKRAYTMTMRDDALAELYKQEPQTREMVKDAAGYGVFSNIGTNIIFVTTGGGFGVVHNNKTGEDTYMKMGEAGVGIGLGITDFRAVFIFHDSGTLNKFVTSGWDFGADAEAVAQSGDQGGGASGAANVSEGMSIYQFTENGIALSASVSGTKYWKDDKLN
jgi:lipid-binding SYLF domain-containing protein